MRLNTNPLNVITLYEPKRELVKTTDPSENFLKKTVVIES